MLLSGGVVKGLSRALRCTCPIWILLIGLINLNSSYAQEKVRVFKNRYVVELNPVAMAAHTSSSNSEPDLKAVGAKVMRSLGAGSRRNVKLIGPNVLAASDAAKGDKGEVIDFDSSDTFCAKLIASGVASSCSPDFEIKILNTPNDPALNQLWGMSAESGIDAPGAWDVTTGSTETIVAVVDTGVDYSHPDLANNMWRNPGEVSGNGIDDDGNGYVDDVYGWNAVSNNGNPMDDNGHGTHCSGTIGGVGNNGVGVSGVNWNVKIMALKFLSANGSGSLSGAVSVLNYMNTMKQRGINIRVASNSWGGGGFDQTLYNTIARSHELGIAFIAAAGNEANDNDVSPAYPASYELSNVVSVAAIDEQRNVASFSNYGANMVDIAAPGVNIYSTWPGNSYRTLSGTSMATPHVAGAVALLLANEPWLTAEAAIDRIYMTGLPLSTLTGVVRTGRLLNANRMVHNVTSPLPQPTPTPVPCEYAATTVGFSPNDTASTGVGVLQADELNFYKVDLPFSFPFHNENVSSFYISPNGVLYTKTAPSSMDYVNKEVAPSNSIAALHTDLTTFDSPYVIKVKTESDRVTVYWYAQAYSMKGAGDIEVWLTIYSDGTIEDYVRFSTAPLQAYVQGRATIGLSGSSSGSSTTYAYNSSAIVSNLGVRFSPLCEGNGGGGGENPGVVSTIELYGKSPSGKLTRRASAGQRVQIGLAGTGNGTVEVSAAFDNRACSQTTTATLLNGTAGLEAKLPKLPSQFSSFKVRSGAVKRSIGVSHAKARSSRRVGRSISARKFEAICGKLFASMTAM